MAAPKKAPPLFIQNSKQAAAQDKATPGKHKPYSKKEAQAEALWQYRMKHKKPGA